LRHGQQVRTCDASIRYASSYRNRSFRTDERWQFELPQTIHYCPLIVHFLATLESLVLFAAHVVMALRVVLRSYTVR
jgi:hypothetical protein